VRTTKLFAANLSHTVNFAKRAHNVSRAAFDNIFVDYTRLSSSSIFLIVNGLLDYNEQCLTVNHIALATNTLPSKQGTRKINTETIMQFHLQLKIETLESVCRSSVTDNMFNSFLYIFLYNLEAHFPLKHKSRGKVKNE
jgi:hypothetical protein